ncbi:MAG: C25 family peptidase propeptide domain-containing protein, partial [candidate division WOR-3 bacterium]
MKHPKSRWLEVVSILLVLIAELQAGVIQQQVKFQESDLTISSLDGQNAVDLVGCDPTTEVGAPQLVEKAVFISLPYRARVTGIRVTRNAEVTVANQFVPIIVQPQVITMPGQEPKKVEPNPRIFDSECPYPTEVAKFVGQGNLGGQPIAMIVVSPLRYLPREHQLSLFKEIDLEVSYRLDGPDPRPAEAQDLPGIFDYL